MTEIHVDDPSGYRTAREGRAGGSSWGARCLDLGEDPSPLSADPDDALAYVYFLAGRAAAAARAPRAARLSADRP